MVEITLHPAVRMLLRPVATALIDKLGKDNLTTESLERLAEGAKAQGMQGEILFGGDKEQFGLIIHRGLEEARKIKDPDERRKVLDFLRIGCLRELVLEEAIRISDGDNLI